MNQKKKYLLKNMKYKILITLGFNFQCKKQKQKQK